MIKLNQYNLDRLEELLEMAGYQVRNEKGNFKSGSCLMEESKIVVLNKFSAVEVKVAFLIEIIQKIPLDVSLLDDKNSKLYREVCQNTVSAESAT